MTLVLSKMTVIKVQFAYRKSIVGKYEPDPRLRVTLNKLVSFSVRNITFNPHYNGPRINIVIKSPRALDVQEKSLMKNNRFFIKTYSSLKYSLIANSQLTYF